MAELTATTDPMLGETLYSGALDCGLRVYILPMPQFHQQFAILGTQYGSIDNHFKHPRTGKDIAVPDGIAHFLEHKMFEKEAGDTFQLFARTGANANANTSFTSTKYLFGCSEGFEENLDILMDMVQEPYFTPQTVDKEKGIIAEEIKMYQDMPGWEVFFQALRGLYLKHPVNIDIAGTVDSIQGITDRILHDCWATFYHPSNMAMFVAGAVDPLKVYRQVRDNYGRRSYEPQAPTERIVPQEPEAVAHRRLSKSMPLARTKFMLGFKDRRPAGPGLDYLRRNITTQLLLGILFGQSSDFYMKHYSDGLIDEDSFSTDWMAERSFGVSMIGGDTDDPEALEQVILDEIRRARTSNVVAENFERVRKKATGKTMRGYTFPEPCAYAMADAFFNGYDFFDPLKELRAVTARDLMARLEEHFDPDNYTVSLVTPTE